MKGSETIEERGFTFIEVLVALAVTLTLMTSVFLLLVKGQSSFQREPQVTEMNAAARTAIDRIAQDLTIAGFESPPNTAIMWFDGGGPPTAPLPDELTIVYSDPEVPRSKPLACGAGGDGSRCTTIGSSSTLSIDPKSFPNYVDPVQAYQVGQILIALQGPNGDPVCDNVAPAIYPFAVTQPPLCYTGDRRDGTRCLALNIDHTPVRSAQINYPSEFQNDVRVDCALVGWFHVVQYRINPLPPTPNPMLERRDIVMGEPWTPVASNVENLQVQYAQGLNLAFADAPPLMPIGADPNTWITQVRVTVTGRTESTGLEGGTQGVFASGDTYVRRSFTTTMSLRNQLGEAAQRGLWN